MCVSIRQLKEEFLARCTKLDVSGSVELWDKLQKLGWDNRDKEQTMNSVDIDATAFVSDQEAEEIRENYGKIAAQSRHPQAIWE